jgi:hypothetical protein
MSIAINVLSTLFSTSTLAKATFDTLSLPVQIALGAIGIGSVGYTAASAGKAGILGVANYRKDGASVLLADGSRGIVTEVGYDFLEVEVEGTLGRPSTTVTLRGDELTKLNEATFKRNPEAGAAARARVAKMRESTTGERSHSSLRAQDSQVNTLIWDNRKLTAKGTETQAAFEAFIAKQAAETEEMKAMFAGTSETTLSFPEEVEVPASSPEAPVEAELEIATPVAATAGLPAEATTPDQGGFEAVAKMAKAAADAEMAEAAEVAAEAVESADSPAEAVEAAKAVLTDAVIAEPAPAAPEAKEATSTEASASVETEVGKPELEEEATA